MLRNSLIMSDFILEALEWLRQRIGKICFVIFLCVNWGNNLAVLKSTFAMLRLGSRGKGETGIDPVYDKMYAELTSPQTDIIFIHTIVSFFIVYIIGFLFVQLVDEIGAPRALMNRDLKRLRNWTRKETRLLETQGRLILTLEYEQALKDQAFKTIRSLEEIIQRYEQTGLALNPNISKRPKLSEKDKKIGDLFDEEPKLNDAPKGFNKFVQFVRKF